MYTCMYICHFYKLNNFDILFLNNYFVYYIHLIWIVKFSLYTVFFYKKEQGNRNDD